MKSIHVLVVFSVLVFSLVSCSKDSTFDDSVYTITTDTTGFYDNDVSQIIESGSFSIAFFSHMEDDTVIRHNAFVYTDKTDGYSLLYKQNRTLDTAFVHELKDGKPTDKALRFYKENDSLIIEDLVYNYENTSFYVKDRTAIDKLESSVLRELGSEISIADIEKQLNETLEYLGKTAVYSYLKEKAKEIADYAEEKANNLAAKLKKAAEKVKETAEKVKDKAVEIKEKVMGEIEKAKLEKQKQELEKKPKETDCEGVTGGPAKVDKCSGKCTGGTTGQLPLSYILSTPVKGTTSCLEDYFIIYVTTNGGLSSSYKVTAWVNSDFPCKIDEGTAGTTPGCYTGLPNNAVAIREDGAWYLCIQIEDDKGCITYFENIKISL